MKFSDIQIGKIYEMKRGERVAPVYVRDILPNGVLAKNLDTKREVFVKKESELISPIENMSDWRLHNGD